MNKKILQISSIVFISLLILGIIYSEMLKIQWLVFFLVMRGIISPNEFWWTMTDLLVQDKVGNNLYFKIKGRSNKKITTINMLGRQIHMITDINFMKQMFDQSPDVFGVGKLKMYFFKSFMSKNVGVSHGDEWKHRRWVNQGSLDSDKLHRFASYYHDYFGELFTNNSKPPQTPADFMYLSQYITMKIVFGDEQIQPQVFKIFADANSYLAPLLGGISLEKTSTYHDYRKYVMEAIENPKFNSLISIANTMEFDKEELFHNIPHWIFPIVGTCFRIIPILLSTISHNNRIRKKLWNELSQMHNSHDPMETYHLPYLRKCLLEVLRFNTAVTTIFRTLRQNYSFGDGYNYKNDDQFLVLSYPVLRDPEYWPNPNEFYPERWTKEQEALYHNIIFGQGPQRCPGKELILFLLQSYMVNFFYKYQLFDGVDIINCSPIINVMNYPDVINPFSVNINYTKLT